jgi:hypothetical protein
LALHDVRGPLDRIKFISAFRVLQKNGPEAQTVAPPQHFGNLCVESHRPPRAGSLDARPFEFSAINNEGSDGVEWEWAMFKIGKEPYGHEWFADQDQRFRAALQRAIDRGWEQAPVVTVDDVVSPPARVPTISMKLP